MKYVTLPYIFQLDIDFLPQTSLHRSLISYILQENFTESRNTAFIVPAFETQRYR